MTQLISVMQSVFDNPPVAFNPAQQTLKNWAMYCLRDRGFMVVSSSKGDFAISTKGEKMPFKVSQTEVDLDRSVGWIVVDALGRTAKVIAPQEA
jgi:hypothetical protein